MAAKSDIFVETLKLMAAFISGFTVYYEVIHIYASSIKTNQQLNGSI